MCASWPNSHGAIDALPGQAGQAAAVTRRMEIAQLEQLRTGGGEACRDQAIERSQVAAVSEVVVAEAPIHARVVSRRANHEVQDVEVFRFERGNAVGQLTCDTLAVLDELARERGLAAGAALGVEGWRRRFLRDSQVLADCG